RLNQRLIPTLVLDTTLASANYTLSLHDALPIYRIEAEQSLLTLESDKASMEIPAPKAGVIKSLAIKLGDRLKEGDDLLELEVDADRKSTRLNSSHVSISYAVFCLKKKKEREANR